MNTVFTILKVFEYLVWGGVGITLIVVLIAGSRLEKKFLRQKRPPPGDWWKSDDESES